MIDIEKMNEFPFQLNLVSIKMYRNWETWRILKIEILMYSPYYTSLDHDAICITLMEAASKNDIR